MATLYLTVLPGKARKNGKNRVRIAVAHRSKTRYVVTDVVLNSPKEWKNGKIVKRDDASYLNLKLLRRVQELQRIIDETPYIEGLTCTELVETITHTRAKRSLTLTAAFEEMLEVSTAKDSTKEHYGSIFRSIVGVIPGNTLVSRVTPLMVQRYIKKRSEELAPVTMQVHCTMLAHLLKFCQVNGYTEFRVLPTHGLINRAVGIRQNWMSPDQVRKIRDTDASGKLALFRDLFMLSYYLGGINVIDLVKVNFDECGKRIKYIRTKTDRREKINRFVEFDIPKEAWPIIKRYKGDDGHLDILTREGGVHSCCYSIGYAGRLFREAF